MPTPRTDDLLKIVARLPASLVIVDENTAPAATPGSASVSGLLRKRDEKANGSFQPLFFELNGARLSFYKEQQQVERHHLNSDANNKEVSDYGGHLDLRSVTSLHPLKSEAERFGFCLATTECTWTLAANTEEDYLRWLRALCDSTATSMSYNAVQMKYKRMLQLQKIPVHAITDVRVSVDINDTIGEIVEHIFNCYKQALDAAPLRAFDAAEFVLRVQDAAGEWSVDLFDRSQEIAVRGGCACRARDLSIDRVEILVLILWHACVQQKQLLDASC